jgi:hypothetical protein
VDSQLQQGSEQAHHRLHWWREWVAHSLAAIETNPLTDSRQQSKLKIGLWEFQWQVHANQK